VTSSLPATVADEREGGEPGLFQVDVLKFVGRYAARKRTVCICKPFDPGGGGEGGGGEEHKCRAKEGKESVYFAVGTLIARAKLSRKPVAAAA
jgi:hypothetical protein